jgi:hypothetical protein
MTPEDQKKGVESPGGKRKEVLELGNAIKNLQGTLKDFLLNQSGVSASLEGEHAQQNAKLITELTASCLKSQELMRELLHVVGPKPKKASLFQSAARVAAGSYKR